MTDVQQFRSSREAEQARPSLDRDCVIAIPEFESLVGSYDFNVTDQVLCQLIKNDSVCKQAHQHGWIAKRKDGTEGYIGQICAGKHFVGDNKFAAEAARIRRELRVNDLLKRLSLKLADQQLTTRLTAWHDRSRDTRDRIMGTYTFNYLDTHF